MSVVIIGRRQHQSPPTERAERDQQQLSDHGRLSGCLLDRPLDPGTLIISTGLSQFLVCSAVVLGWMQHGGRRNPACGDCSQYANAVADVVGLHRRGRRPGVLWGDPNAQYAGADPEADRRVEFDGFAVDTQRDGLCGVDLERRGRPLSQQ